MSELSENSTIKFSLEESFLYAESNDFFLSIRLISREYPKYQKIIPEKFPIEIRLSNLLLFDALKRIKIMSNEKSSAIKINIKENRMIITAQHQQFGNAEETIPIKYNEKELNIGFNAKYLSDTLSVYEDDEIIFSLESETKPVMIRSVERSNSFGIVMPLIIQF